MCLSRHVRERDEACLSSAHYINSAVVKREGMCCSLVNIYVGLQGLELSHHCLIGLHSHDIEIWLLR